MRHGPVLTAFARAFAVVGLVTVAVVVDYRDMIALFTLPFGIAQEQPQEVAPAASTPSPVFDEVSDKRCYSVTVQCDESALALGEDLAERLKARGFCVRNVFTCDIPRSYVVFGDPDEQAAAESIVGMLGFGEALGAREGSNYKGDLLVLVGRDAL